MITPRIIAQAKQIQIRRREPPTFVKGFPQKSPERRFTIVASVQPLTGRQILQVEEADRSREHINIFTQGDIKRDDTVIYLCREFEVQRVEIWENQGLNLVHKKALAVLKDVNKEGV